MRVTVLGCGVAGMGTALLLRRAGHDVILVDREPQTLAATADEIFEASERPTVPQFRQPHNFLGLGRRLLLKRLPDVYAKLREMGAGEIDQSSFLPAGSSREPSDDDFAVIQCRRPVFDAALRGAVGIEPELGLFEAKAIGLTSRDGRVDGVVLDGGEEIASDLVVDAMGRASHLPRWLTEQGFRAPLETVADCGLVYFSRHFRVRDGQDVPPFTSLLGGPRGDTGFLSYSTFVGDNRTFCTCVMPTAMDRDLRALRGNAAYMRVATLLPGYPDWIDPQVSEPITPVLPMGAIRNMIRSYVTVDGVLAPGMVGIGDALLHTNPTSAFGAAQSLEHAAAVTDALSDASDPTEAALRFDERIRFVARSRFEAVANEDRDRLRMYDGEPIDVSDPRDSVSLFLRLVLPRAAVHDAELLRAVLRRVNMFDPPDLLANDPDLLDRGRDIFREETGDPEAWPSRMQVLAAIAGER